MTMVMDLQRNLGRCKSCKRGHRVDGSNAWSVECGCGATVRLQRVIAFRDENVKCGGACRNAVGPSCDCSCGGANHGINH